jgi:hypothetical protein
MNRAQSINLIVGNWKKWNPMPTHLFFYNNSCRIPTIIRFFGKIRLKYRSNYDKGGYIEKGRINRKNKKEIPCG